MFFKAWPALIFLGGRAAFFAAAAVFFGAAAVFFGTAADFFSTAAVFFGAAAVVLGAGPDVLFAAPVVLPAAARLPGRDIVETTLPLAASTGEADERPAFFVGTLAALPTRADVFLATDLPETGVLTIALRAAALPVAVLPAADAVLLGAVFVAELVAVLPAVLPAALPAALPAMVLPAALPTLAFLPGNCLLAPFLVAMLDSRSIWPLRQRRQSR